jgi:GDP-L-fucose synthase
MEHYDDPQTINVGTGQDVSIAELADMVRAVVYPEAEIRYDTTKPDGTPRKLLDVSRIHGLGWRHQIELEQGIRETYDWLLKNIEHDAVRLGGTEVGDERSVDGGEMGVGIGHRLDE